MKPVVYYPASLRSQLNSFIICGRKESSPLLFYWIVYFTCTPCIKGIQHPLLVDVRSSSVEYICIVTHCDSCKCKSCKCFFLWFICLCFLKPLVTMWLCVCPPDQMQGTVTLRNISTSTSGLYQCTSSNAIGKSTCLLNLQVVARKYTQTHCSFSAWWMWQCYCHTVQTCVHL